MRKESEKRNKVISIRMTEKLYEKLQAEADAKGKKLNGLIVDKLEHGEKAITPAITVKMQNIVNTAFENAAQDKKEYIRKEMDTIWQLLVLSEPTYSVLQK